MPEALPKKRCCPYCGERIQRIGEDALDYCPGCELIVEGETVVCDEEDEA